MTEAIGQYTGCVSFVAGAVSREVRFTSLSDERLRELVMPISPDVRRDQLMALCLNRWPCGYLVEMEDVGEWCQ